MRTLGLTVLFTVSCLFSGQHQTLAGESFPDLSSLPNGFRYCPAPGADNSEFNCSYYAIDAQTGQLSRYTDGQPRQDLGPVDMEEKILFVAPQVDVENKYVPVPGGMPQQPPAEFANSNHGYNPNKLQPVPQQQTRRQSRTQRANNARHMQQQQMRQQQQQQQQFYAQPQQYNNNQQSDQRQPQEYANADGQNSKRPFWKRQAR